MMGLEGLQKLVLLLQLKIYNLFKLKIQLVHMSRGKSKNLKL